MTLDAALRTLESFHPRARFFQSAPIAGGRTEEEDVDQEFHLVSLYEHAITNAFRPLGGYRFIISNGFLGSHVYNLALVCQLFDPDDPEFGEGWFRNALRHNLKKFFAECCLGEANCLLGRAFLIETLAYEQGLMERVFRRVEEDPGIGALAAKLATAMMWMLSFHEMGHYFIERTGVSPLKEAAQASGIDLPGQLAGFSASHGDNMAEELQCDLFAALRLADEENTDLPGLERSHRLRLAAFHFETFSHLDSLYLSARETARGGATQDAAIDLGSEKKTGHAFTFTQGRSFELDQRRDILMPLLEQLAAGEGPGLLGSDGLFRFDRLIIDEMRSAWENCLEPIAPLDGGLTGTDPGRRGLAQLIAESLHGCDDGAEHLLWRSKRLSVGGSPVDP